MNQRNDEGVSLAPRVAKPAPPPAEPAFEPGAWRAPVRQHPSDPTLRARKRLLSGAFLTVAFAVVMIGIELVLQASAFMGENARFAMFSSYAFRGGDMWNYLWGFAEPQVLTTLISHQFLHGGLMHLAFNMIVLVILAPDLERAVGKIGFVALFLLCGVAGAMAQFLWELGVWRYTGDAFGLTTPMIGASGAIFGLLGARFAGQTIAMSKLPAERLAQSPVAYLLKASIGVLLINFGFEALNLMGGQGMRIAGAAHIGGFLLGLPLGALMLRRYSEPPPSMVKPASPWRDGDQE